MRRIAMASSFMFAAGVAAQSAPAPEPKSASPVAPPSEAGQNVRQPSPSRHQFSSPVMAIDIKGEGVALPAGIERDESMSPPSIVPVPAKPPATVR